uniref:NADH-ubiquinone oxidoreductase chain 5 n=1 Tax=Oltmannsiellopsis viridis TaxID=51324 RepID=Q0QIQ0_OLTVI|nr:NADH dehydrogenase subunit 5 [Oltmannsiellopsis viridis]ABC96353.1 NADH dehydrogenase subunit 5 [Oltmannsiellopsis viridis]
MYLCLVFLPLMGSLLTLTFGRFLGFRGAALLTTSCTFTAFVLSCVAFYEVALCASPCYIKLAPWFETELFDASWGFMFDTLTVVMLIVVTSVSTLVHLYSISYMAGDPHIPRFMSYLSVFTFFMLMLVTADNFVQLFFGWEGVGLASYLLINFWFTRLQANKAAIKAMMVNRVGDVGLALGIFGIFYFYKTTDYLTVFASTPTLMEASRPTMILLNMEVDALDAICILLFIGAVGKSAQLGLHTWLPDAMEGPTPVSALIHAATMVTAGVFLISRCSPVFEYAPTALVVVTFGGAMTCFFAATTGVVQNDLKRVIAYSTCSQLGYMIFACGLSNYSVGVFHLMNHAFFKALLFLGAGSVIHALADEQNMLKMGGVAKAIPFTYSMMFIGSLSLAGIPFLTGFYSKDVILEVAYAKYTIAGNFAYLLGSLCVAFTSYYSFRLLILTFLTPTQAHKSAIKVVEEASLLMSIPLVILAFGSIFVGYTFKDAFIGLGTNFWNNALFTLPQNTNLLESEYIPQASKMLPLVSIFLGAILALIINYTSPGISNILKTSTNGRLLYIFLNKRWLVDKVYNDVIGYPALKLGYHTTFKAIDKGILELIGPLGISKTVATLIVKLSRIQSGFVYHYAVIMLGGIVLLVAFSQIGVNFDLRLALIWLCAMWVF